MGIGVMSYRDGEYSPEGYAIKVLLPYDQFRDLLTAAQLGNVPSEITVHERGMKLLDSEEREWDNKSSPRLYVASIDFSVPLAGYGKQIIQLERSLRATTSLLEKAGIRLKRAATGLIVILVFAVLLFKYSL